MRSAALVALLLAACDGSPAGASGDDVGGDDVAGDDAPSDGAPDGDGPIDGGLDMMVGSDAPPVDECPANTWCTETTTIGATVTLRAVHVVDPTDVFAVGDGGVIIRRQNNVWTTMTSNTTANLLGVWGASATDVWAVGDDGAVMRWNGSAWSAMQGAPNADYVGVWGSGASHVVLVGTASARTWNGSTWAAKSIVGSPNTVHGTRATDVWIAAEIGGLNHYTGSWSTVSTGSGTTLFAAYALSPTDVWVSGGTNNTTHFDGTSWTGKASGGNFFNDFYATGSNDVWGVSQTKIGRWNGSAWTVATPAANTAFLNAIDGKGEHIWAVGKNRTILHRTN